MRVAPSSRRPARTCIAEPEEHKHGCPGTAAEPRAWPHASCAADGANRDEGSEPAALPRRCISRDTGMAEGERSCSGHHRLGGSCLRVACDTWGSCACVGFQVGALGPAAGLRRDSSSGSLVLMSEEVMRAFRREEPCSWPGFTWDEATGACPMRASRPNFIYSLRHHTSHHTSHFTSPTPSVPAPALHPQSPPHLTTPHLSPH